MQNENKPDPGLKTAPQPEKRPGMELVFGEARNFLDNRFIYVVFSQRAHGLSIGINMNPDQNCNFKCVYCEVARTPESQDRKLDLSVMAAELKKVLALVHKGQLQELPEYRTVPEELMRLRMVTLSGDGEPTLCPDFEQVVQELVHLRAHSTYPFYKMVLITNGTGLHLPTVQNGLRWFTASDEVWTKLDTGTQEAMDRVNRSHVHLDRIMENILMLGRQRPIIIQSLFPLLNEAEPSAQEIQEYVQRLAELKAGGAMIAHVQIYSAHRPTALPHCRHLSLKCLSNIAHQVRTIAGLKAEVF